MDPGLLLKGRQQELFHANKARLKRNEKAERKHLNSNTVHFSRTQGKW